MGGNALTGAPDAVAPEEEVVDTPVEGEAEEPTLEDTPEETAEEAEEAVE